jgi:hypothetical protein
MMDAHRGSYVVLSLFYPRNSGNYHVGIKEFRKVRIVSLEYYVVSACIKTITRGEELQFGCVRLGLVRLIKHMRRRPLPVTSL